MSRGRAGGRAGAVAWHYDPRAYNNGHLQNNKHNPSLKVHKTTGPLKSVILHEVTLPITHMPGLCIGVCVCVCVFRYVCVSVFVCVCVCFDVCYRQAVC